MPPDGFLSLEQYLTLARRMIGRFAPQSFRRTLLRDDDAIGYVAHKIMRADWEFDPSRQVKIGTWRGYRAKRAIWRYVASCCDATKHRPVSLDDSAESSSFSLHRVTCLRKEPDHVLIENRDDNRHRIAGLMAKLTRMQRECVTLRYLEGFTPIEIAEKLGISRQGAQQNIDRAMRALRPPSETRHE